MGLLSHWRFPCVLLWKKTRAEVSAGSALLDVESHDGVRVLSYPKDTFMFKTLTALPQAHVLSSKYLFAQNNFLSLSPCFSDAELIVCVG